MAYTDPDELKLTTIENVIYVTMKNDISFLIGSQMNLYEQPLPYGKLTTSCEAGSRGGSQMNLYEQPLPCGKLTTSCEAGSRGGSQMNLYEQQSTFNPNMPLRGLMYFAQLYQMNLSARGLDLFGSTLVKIPSPSFVVFYNGDRKLPDVSEQKLSDAFEPAGSATGFEWTAKVINIGGNHSEGLQKKCKALYDYSSYVNRMKGNLKAGMPNREAVSEALDYAIKGNLLDGYFKSQKMEVLNMSLTEFNQEEYDRNRRREGMEEGEKIGFERGERSGKQETARNLLAMGILSYEQIAQATDLSLEELQAL
ncbi:MAG: hypothetical protein K6G18_05655 [Treponema sp.]|nr:hypothetical protein [Treponema sp.]